MNKNNNLTVECTGALIDRCNFIKNLSVLCLLFSLCIFFAQKSYAASQELSVTGLRNLASNFVSRLGPSYTIDKKRDEINQIPDGATLLLRPRSQKVNYEEDIYAVKEDGKIYLAFEDVVNILEFAISFSKEGDFAQGWYLREDWKLVFDRAKKEILSRGLSFNITDDELLEKDGILFVHGDSLANWLGLIFTYDISQQIIDIQSPFPLPAVARNLRHRRASDLYETDMKEAELPRLEPDLQLFDINTADITLATSYQKNSSGKSSRTERGTIAAEGEVLGHSAYIYGAADTNEDLTNILARLTRRSEKADLLGPLKARSYGIGDIDIADIPLTGSVSQDLGFRIDNNPLENNDFAVTDIEGDGIPGWDVELYRNGILIDTQTIEQDGRYLFADIELFIGNNGFELYFYGPQGEIRYEDLEIPVSRELLASQNNTYEVSVTFEETQTFSKLTNDEDEGAPQIAARYNRMIADNALGYVGLRSRQLNEDRRTILSSGLSTIWGDTLIDTNAAADQEGNLALEAILRRNIQGWDTSFRTQINSDEFITSDITDPMVLDLSFNVQKKLPQYSKFNGNILGSARYQESAAGSKIQSGDIGISQRYKGASISNRLYYEETSPAGGGAGTERFDHLFSARKAFHKFYLRAGSTYRFKPDMELAALTGQVNYIRNEKFSADATIERQLANDLDVLRLNANVKNDHFTTSPFVRLDTDDQVLAGVTLNFNLTDEPNQFLPAMSHRRLTGRGMISTFVYHDKNGNYVFDAGDEPVQGAIVESLNIRRRTETDENGYAVMREMQTTRPTDIVVEQESLPDPFLVVASKGRSVLPTAGTIHQLSFPLHTSGEIEGNVILRTPQSERALGYQRVKLVSLDDPAQEPLSVRAASDGFYLSFLVPPGRYMILPEVPIRKRDRLGNQVPPVIDIGYDGTILKDVDIVLDQGRAFVPYDVQFVKEGPAIAHRLDKMTLVLKVKQGGNSMLTDLLGRLIMNRYAANILSGLTALDLGPDVTGDQEPGYKFYTQEAQDPDYIHRHCAALNARDISCEVMVLMPMLSHENQRIAGL